MKNEKLNPYRMLYSFGQVVRQQKIFLLTIAFLTLYSLHQYNYGNVSESSYPPISAEKIKNINATTPWEKSLYFNTKFLAKHHLVNAKLKREGFKEGYFHTEDNFTINYLFLERPRATSTVIVCCGWLPGKKEGMASLFKIAPENCNLLFFDARGHGGSNGSLIKSALTYGKNEYKDLIAALKFAHAQVDLPIIIFGICAGAFHAVHAVAELEQQNMINTLRIAGLVFDSGWGSLSTTSRSVPRAKIKEALTACATPLLGKKNASKNLLVCGLASALGAICDCVHWTIYRPFIDEEQTNIFSKIPLLTIPIFFIHAADDNYVAIEEVKQLASHAQDPHCWWIDEPSRHACNHLKHKQVYREKLCSFIEEVGKPSH